MTITLFNNQIFTVSYILFWWWLLLFLYVVIFTHKNRRNLQKQGGFIPGIRPGRLTAEYLQYTINRILWPVLSFGSDCSLAFNYERRDRYKLLVVGGTRFCCFCGY